MLHKYIVEVFFMKLRRFFIGIVSLFIVAIVNISYSNTMKIMVQTFEIHAGTVLCSYYLIKIMTTEQILVFLTEANLFTNMDSMLPK